MNFLVSLVVVFFHNFIYTKAVLLFFFVPSVIPYRAVIIPIKTLSNAMTTSNPWLCVSGELGDSGVMQIPKNVLEMTFDVSALTSALPFSWQRLLVVMELCRS